jgi:hypothetical protein
LFTKKEIDSFPASLKPKIIFLWELQQADVEQDLKILASTSISCLTDRPMNVDERRRLR